MTISLISAFDLNRGIGYKNKLLTYLSNDLEHFKEKTLNKTIIMGRNTYESLPNKPLPKRNNVVITRNKEYNPHGCLVYHSVKELIDEYRTFINQNEELMIIGGESIYKQFLQYADKIYATVIDHEFKKVDTYFPAIDLNEWKITSSIKNKADEINPYDHYFVTYERK